eukprot:gene2174-2038_t
MNITLINDPKTLFKDYQKYFEENEAENNLIIALFRNLGTRYKTFYIFLIKNQEEFSSIYLMTPPHNLILYYKKEDKQEKEKKYNLLIDYLFENKIQIPGVLGSNEDVELFQMIYNNKKKINYEVLMNEGIYQLLKQDLKIHENEKETLKISVCSNIEEIFELCISFVNEANPFDKRTKEEIYVDMKRQVDSGGFFKLENENGDIVSICLANGKTINGLRVQLVFTEKKYRKNGYASVLVSKVCEKYFEESDLKFMFLFTDLSNPTANKIYQQIGFKMVTTFLMAKF